MSKSAKVLVFANNEQKELRAKGQELAHSTFTGFLIVNRSPRYFNEEAPEIEPCAAIFVDKKAYPAVAEAYEKAGAKVFGLALPTKPAKAAKAAKETEALAAEEKD